jgi:hypothetical protein
MIIISGNRSNVPEKLPARNQASCGAGAQYERDRFRRQVSTLEKVWLLDSLARDPEHRLGDVDRHEAAVIADRCGQRHS